MTTLETLIVFAALMAIIALVAIAIDWMGKPLRNRRFIPRLYRYDDEILPFVPTSPMAQPTIPAAMVSPHQYPLAHHAPDDRTAARTETAAAQPVPVPVATVNAKSHVAVHAVAAQAVAVGQASASPSPFSAHLAGPPPSAGEPMPTFAEVVAETTSAGMGDPPHEPSPPQADGWSVGMSLDARMNDRKPTTADKAERLWRTLGADATDSPFDDDDRELMIAGKAPRRLNPRTGKDETMQLVGLRQASDPSAVRMRWPDDAIDPWSSR